MSTFDSWAFMPLIGLAVYLAGVALALLLLYGIVRVAVTRGMRDHQLWLEKTGRSSGTPPYDPDSARNF